MEPENVKKELAECLKELTRLSTDDWNRTAALGQKLGFPELSVPFDQLLALLRRLDIQFAASTCISLVIRLNEELGRLKAELANIRQFDAGVGNPAQRRNQLLQSSSSAILRCTDAAFALVAPTFAPQPSIPTDTISSAVSVEAKRIHETLAKFRSEVDTLKQSIVQAQTSIATPAVEAHESLFAKNASAHLRRSWLWLTATGVFGIASSVASWQLVRDTASRLIGSSGSTSPSPEIVAEVLLARLAVLPFLYLVLFWSARNYRAEMHNYVANTHRATALATFHQLSAAAMEPRTMASILSRAADAIFIPGASGYIEAATASGSEANVVSEVRRIVQETAD